MTSPPRPRIAAKSLPKVDCETGIEESPFHSTVHEPREAVWRNAIVRCFAPDCCDRVLGLAPVHASKYGANTWAGRAFAVAAWAEPASTTAPAAPTSARPATTAVMRRDRRNG